MVGGLARERDGDGWMRSRREGVQDIQKAKTAARGNAVDQAVGIHDFVTLGGIEALGSLAVDLESVSGRS